jgi:CubicO group peptidase (beta-lactamase class C family)
MKYRWITHVLLFLFIGIGSNNLISGQIVSAGGKKISAAEMDQFLQSQLDSIGMPGLSIAIISNGKIVYHRALGIANVDTKIKTDENSIFEAASLSKPVFTYLVMKMVDKGLLNLDTPLYKYMPYADIAGDERYKLITARIVLTHRTGFPNWRYFEKADTSMHIKRGDLYLKFTPGTQYSYSGEGFLYLAKVIAHLNRLNLQTLEPLYELEVARPLGMGHAYYTGNDYIYKHKVSGHVDGKVTFFNGSIWPICFPGWDSSYFNPAAGLHTDAISYAHFMIGLMNGKGLSNKSFAEMLKPQSILPKDKVNEDGDFAEGLGLFIAKTPYGTVYEHGGNNDNFQSHFLWYSSPKDGYVFFTNCDKGVDFNKRLKLFLTDNK